MQGRSDPNPELLDAGALCRQLVPEGSVHAFLADHRAELFPDEAFSDLFPSGTGRPSVPAEVMASAMVLKELEGHSDRQAADALRCDIGWKVATGLALDHPGVHFTVFTHWRTRLDRSARPERIREAVAEVIEATGVLAGRRRRALDSTLLDDAVATQDTVTQLVSAIRRVRKLIPQAGAVTVSAHDYDAAGKPVCGWDDPEAKAALVSALVNDARAIIAALEGVELSGQQADAVGLLALVAGQDVEPGEEEGTNSAGRLGLRLGPDPSRSAHRRPHPDDQAHPAARRRARGLHQGRLRHRHRRRHRHLSRRSDRRHHVGQQRRLRDPLSHVPAYVALHDGAEGSDS